MLKVGIFCLTAPIALIYGFHARRKAPERALAWAGLALSLIVFIPFVMMMIGSVLNLREALCR
jgi:hypothetical protein